MTHLLRKIRNRLLNRFVGALGAISVPGTPLVGALQAWALRSMGASCPHDTLWIGPEVWFDHPENITFGERVTLNPDSRITAFDRVVIGDDFLAAPGLSINAGTHDLATLAPASAPVVVGHRVWCGARVTICAGVELGDDAVIGAGAVVVRSLPARQVCLGVPARPVRDITALREAAGRVWSNFSRRPPA
jgi:acetyltransferase-like isoleucine patch superfamily enzyme